jgi:hypothetical protein
LGSLGFVAENIRTERHEADRIKERQPILAIIGNPPSLRDLVGRIAELVDLFDRADQFLERALGATLSRDALGLGEAEAVVVDV